MTSSPRARLRALGAQLGQTIATASYLRKWIVLGILIGAVAGLGAAAFYSLLQLAS